jgi:hypothetical protein
LSADSNPQPNFPPSPADTVGENTVQPNSGNEQCEHAKGGGYLGDEPLDHQRSIDDLTERDHIGEADLPVYRLSDAEHVSRQQFRIAKKMVQIRSVAAIVGVLLRLGIQQVPDDPKAAAQVRVDTTMYVLNCAFGNSDRRDPSAERDVLWSIRAIVIPYEAAEWQYTLRQRVVGRVDVDLVKVLGTRVTGDVRTDRASTCNELRTWVKKDRRRVDAKDCAPIRTAVTRLQALRLSALPDASITVDASQYFIAASTIEGDEYFWRIAVDSRSNRSLSKTLPEWS